MITTVSCVLVEIMMIVNICSLSVILAKEFRTTEEMMYYKWLQMLGEALAIFFSVEVAFIACWPIYERLALTRITRKGSNYSWIFNHDSPPILAAEVLGDRAEQRTAIEEMLAIEEQRDRGAGD